MKRNHKIFIISGPSGSGKTTLYKRLLKSPRLKGILKKAVSVTTRPLRKNEKQGRDYEFVSRQEFLRLKKNGQLLESQNIFGYLYGTSRKNVESILKEGRDVFLCVDVKGEKAIKKIFKNVISVFVLPPSIAALEKRLKNRLTEAKKDLRKRLLVANEEIRQSRRYDYVIVNDRLNKAYKKLKEIILSNY